MTNFHRARFGLAVAAAAIALLAACASTPPPPAATHKQQVVALLKSIQTGDPAPLGYINPDKYIQHNLAIADGLPGLKAMLASLPKGSARVDTVRVFEDGNFVFTHTNYDFFGPKVGMDVFRFQNGKIAEHWDTIEAIPPQAEWKNPNGKF